MGFIDDIGLSSYIPDMAAPKYIQDSIPVKKIINGTIVTKDQRYLKIFEIKPINFHMRSYEEQDDIVHYFSSWLSVSPVNIQIKIMTQTGNPDEIIERVLERYEKDQDEDVYYPIKHYIDLLERIGNQGAITRKFYMVISYEPSMDIGRLTDEEEIAEYLDREVSIIKGYMSRTGNVVSYMGEKNGFVNNEIENAAVTKFLYEFFNPRTQEIVPYEKRVERLEHDIKKVQEDKNAKPDLASVISPTGLDVNDPDCVLIDGKYYAYLIIDGNGYPERVYGGWFDQIISLTNSGDSVDLYFHKENKKKVLTYISRKIRLTGLSLDEKNESQRDWEQTSSAYNAAKYIKQCINANNEQPFQLVTIITLCSDRYNDLINRKRDVKERLEAVSIIVNECRYMQEEAMKCTYPFLSMSPKIYQKGRRNVMNRGLASCYPFTSYEMQNDNGFLLGLNLYNNTLCVLNPFDTKSYKNANMVLLGTSGSGKTYTEQLIALRLREIGIQCFILAPYKAHEYSRTCEQVNGSFIKVAPASKDHINIMDIRPQISESSKILQGESADNVVFISDKTQTIIAFIQLVVPDMTNEEQQMIDTAIVETYHQYGINEDNNSIYIDAEKPELGLKTMPILGDLYNNLIKMNKTGNLDRIINIMSQFVSGSARSFNNRTNVDLYNKYIVFDLSDLAGNMVAAGMFVALDFVMGRVKEDVLERKMVFIDEGWKLIGSGSNEKAAEYVQEIFKTIRGYNGGACIATQDIKDFFSLEGGKYGNAILSNSKIKIVLQLESGELDFIEKELNLTRQERRDIQNYQRGSCLICANTNHVPVNVIGSEYATKLITTDPAMVRRVAEKIKENGGILK